jgi:quercetin dioxygenase-like cupin family protein
MKIHSIWEPRLPLELHQDERGRIADVFYNDSVQHVTMVESLAKAIRGNHYHRETVQYMLIVRGELEYWWKPLDSDAAAQMVVARVGDLIETPANEIHALRITKDNAFIVFTTGKRGGKDYEQDTVRVKEPIIK